MRKENKYHYIYKTTNLKNGKFYVGMHSTNNLKDGYLGSGYKLRRSINKYGKENFNVEILEYFPNRTSLKSKEKELVNTELLKDPMCMNLVYGGNGGYISPEGVKLGAINRNKKMWKDAEYVSKMKEVARNTYNRLWKEGKLKNNPWPKGKPLNEEHKQKIGKANSLKQKGENNSQYGTCWITNGTENKKVNKANELPNGWELGRKLKK
jgi:group I intron endonuclease